MVAQKNSRRSGPCLLEGGLRLKNPSNRRFFRPEANFYHRCTAVNVQKRNISRHVAGYEHFLEPLGPKYHPFPEAVWRHLDSGRWLRGQISLDRGWLSQQRKPRNKHFLLLFRFYRFWSFLFIVVIVISILLKTAFWQTLFHSQSLVKSLQRINNIVIFY